MGAQSPTYQRRAAENKFPLSTLNSGVRFFTSTPAHHCVAVKSSVGAEGRNHSGGRESGLLQKLRWGWGERWLISSYPHSVPDSGFLRKNSLFSFSIQDPKRGTCAGGGREEQRGKGGSSLPLSFFPGQPLAPNLCRLLAEEPEILARTGGGGRAVCPKLRTYGRTGWEQRKRSYHMALFSSATINKPTCKSQNIFFHQKHLFICLR